MERTFWLDRTEAYPKSCTHETHRWIFGEIKKKTEVLGLPTKWESWEADMREISSRFEGILIILRSDGEDDSDQKMLYFLNGKMQTASVKVSFGQFDQEKAV